MKVHPLWRVKTKETTSSFWIIAPTAVDALRRLIRLFKKKGWMTPKITSIESEGTVDFIPALKKPHYEV